MKKLINSHKEKCIAKISLLLLIMESTRQNKVARLLQKEISEIFVIEGRGYYGNSMVTVTRVRVAPDLSLAKVYLSIFATGQNDKKEILKNKKGRIKIVLMNPEVIAGIGNIYASEVLWQAKIHPEKNVAKLNEKELKSLYQAIKKVLALAVKLGGESFSDYRKPDGSKGDFDAERKVYNREGEKCERCGTKIKRIKFGGRSAFYCPDCQKT